MKYDLRGKTALCLLHTMVPLQVLKTKLSLVAFYLGGINKHQLYDETLKEPTYILIKDAVFYSIH